MTVLLRIIEATIAATKRINTPFGRFGIIFPVAIASHPGTSVVKRTGFKSEIIRARPCAAFIVARVAINGGSFRIVIKRPLITPQSPPTRIPTRIPVQTFRFKPSTNLPTITATRAVAVPIERSIPPVIITKVVPIAIRPMTVVDIKIPPETFSHDAKTGRIIVKNMKITTRLASARTRPISRFAKAAILFPPSTFPSVTFAVSLIALSFPGLVEILI